MTKQAVKIGGKTIEYIRFLNRFIKVKALASMCNYSDDVIRKALHANGLTQRQENRVREALTPWVEQVMEGLQDMYDELENEIR